MKITQFQKLSANAYTLINIHAKHITLHSQVHTHTSLSTANVPQAMNETKRHRYRSNHQKRAGQANNGRSI